MVSMLTMKLVFSPEFAVIISPFKIQRQFRDFFLPFGFVHIVFVFVKAAAALFVNLIAVAIVSLRP